VEEARRLAAVGPRRGGRGGGRGAARLGEAAAHGGWRGGRCCQGGPQPSDPRGTSAVKEAVAGRRASGTDAGLEGHQGGERAAAGKSSKF
jgi:hypothetical protein